MIGMALVTVHHSNAIEETPQLSTALARVGLHPKKHVYSTVVESKLLHIISEGS